MSDPTVRSAEDRPPQRIQPAAESAGIHLATHPAEIDQREAGKGLFRWMGIDLVAEWGILAFVALAVLVSVDLTPLATRTTLIVLIILAVVAYIALAVAGHRAAARASIRPRYRRTSVPAERFRVVGRPQDLARAEAIIQRAIASGGQDASEPELFRITHASEPRRTMTRRATVSIALALAAIAVVVAISPIDFEFHPLLVLLPLAIARIIWGFAWPTYIRIVPGRVDILRYPFLGAGEPTAQPLPLKNTRILLNLRHGRIFIHSDGAPRGDPNGEWLSGVIGGPIRRGREMALAILAAALSSFEPPPLDEPLHPAPTAEPRAT